MNVIRKGHHERITKKIKKINPKNMNNTTLMSFEENLRDRNKKDDPSLYSLIKNTRLSKERRKTKNKNRTISKRKHPNSQRTNYSVTKK